MSSIVGGSRSITVATDYGFQIQTWSQATGSVRINTPSTTGAVIDWLQVSLSIFR